MTPALTFVRMLREQVTMFVVWRGFNAP